MNGLSSLPQGDVDPGYVESNKWNGLAFTGVPGGVPKLMGRTGENPLGLHSSSEESARIKSGSFGAVPSSIESARRKSGSFGTLSVSIAKKGAGGQNCDFLNSFQYICLGHTHHWRTPESFAL